MSSNIKQYKRAFDLSQDLADKLQIQKYPIDIFDILKHKELPKILLSSFADYKNWAKTLGIKCPNELKDAKCYYRVDEDIYLIVYNDKKPDRRVRFSLAHELAHIILKHLNDERTEIDRGGLDDYIYFAMEGAANTFAGNFLAPPILVHERLSGRHFSIFNILDISRFFNLSKQAVGNYRMRDYHYWLSMPHSAHEERILARCRDRMFPHVCPDCFNISYGKDYLFCPVCGKQSLSNYESEGVTLAKYDGVHLDGNGRTSECPVCGNEEHVENATFCMICGSPAINQCLAAISPYGECAHTEPLPGNARYCPYCGATTTFFENKLLPSWEEINTPSTPFD